MNDFESPLIDFRRLRKMNHAVTLCVLALLVIGTVAVWSASSIRDEPKLQMLYLQHAEVGLVGLACYFMLACVNCKIFLRFSWVFYGCALGLLVMVLFMGTTIMGARRWLFFFQPSEIAKLALIMALAEFLGNMPLRRGVAAYFGALALAALPIGLILLQPDLGTSLVFVILAMTLLFARGCAPKLFAWHAGLTTTFAAFVFGMILLSEQPWLKPEHAQLARRATLLENYQRERILTFVFPERDRYNSGWTRWQSEIAVGSGGMWGKGLKKGDRNVPGYLPDAVTTNLLAVSSNELNYLPASVTSNDFIFSVLAEEAGFAGSVAVVALELALALLILGTAFACPEPAGRLFCVGVASVVFWHSFVNIAMTVGLMPVTGLPLPFISYGRTFVFMLLVALGITQSFAARKSERARF